MRNAKTPLGIMLATLALVACGPRHEQQNADENMTLDEGIPSGQLPANADIETLPADESSATPSNQLQNGIDGPDVNDSATNAE